MTLLLVRLAPKILFNLKLIIVSSSSNKDLKEIRFKETLNIVLKTVIEIVERFGWRIQYIL